MHYLTCLLDVAFLGVLAGLDDGLEALMRASRAVVADPVLAHLEAEEVETGTMPLVGGQGVADPRLLWLQFQPDACQPLGAPLPYLLHDLAVLMEDHEVIGVLHHGRFPMPMYLPLDRGR